MNTAVKNEGLAQANRRAAERARKIGKKMQVEVLKKCQQEKPDVKHKTEQSR